MPVKRSLRLDENSEGNSFHPSRITSKRNMTYSPTTGTRQLSPFSSPMTSEEQEHRPCLSHGKRKKRNYHSSTQRKDSTATDNDEFMMLLSEVEQSSDKIMKIMQNLRSIQALEGNKDLENLIGISHTPCFLKKEIEKTKELMTKVTRQKLFEKKSSGLPHKEHHLGSYDFLQAMLHEAHRRNAL